MKFTQFVIMYVFPKKSSQLLNILLRPSNFNLENIYNVMAKLRYVPMKKIFAQNLAIHVGDLCYVRGCV